MLTPTQEHKDGKGTKQPCRQKWLNQSLSAILYHQPPTAGIGTLDEVALCQGEKLCVCPIYAPIHQG